jgi:predicted anti-sigma-YlaC factor YlaD
MDCMRREISKELDGELDEAGEALLRSHLETCRDCRGFRESLLELRSLHSGLDELEPPPTLVDSVMEVLDEPAAPRWLQGWPRIVVPAAAALVIFLGVLAGGRLAELLMPVNGTNTVSVFGFEYLEEHPPGSIGELMLAESQGGVDDE